MLSGPVPSAEAAARRLNLNAGSVYALLSEPEDTKRLPRAVIWVVVVVTLAPFLIIAAGGSFASPAYPFDAHVVGGLSPVPQVEALHRALSGSFTHTILEWSAFCAAIFTVILAWTHFAIRKSDVTTPIIGMALLCAGCMDAFHTLAADHLIDAPADHARLIPFTWALCRLFSALIMIIGVLIVLRRKRIDRTTPVWIVCAASIGLGLVAYGTIRLCAGADSLPQTMHPESLVSRPYDIGSLVLFVYAGVFVFPRLHRVAPSFFSHALLVSVFPQVVTQMHVAFGSAALFDSHFNVAHFLKIVAYLVPFAGLCMDYFDVSRSADRTIHVLKRSEESKDRLLYDMKKRVKELSCMYGVAKALRERETLEAVFRDVASLIPSGWQYPGITRAKVRFDDEDYVSQPFKETRWNQTSDIIVGRERKGTVEIYYIEQRPVLDEGPFLNEERHLIDGIAQALSETVERKHSEEALVEYAVSLESANEALTEAKAATDEARQALEGTVSQLCVANEELAHKNVELDQFSYVASHDLQEPLRKLTAFSSLLTKDLGSDLPDQAAKDLGFITDAAKRMHTLVQDLLSLSRAGRSAMKHDRVSLGDCADDALEMLTQRIEETGATVTRDELPDVAGDATMLTQLYQNLISNALKFVKPGRRTVIRITAERINGEWVFGLRDNGIGIKPEYAELIFAPFKRLHGCGEYSGSGIGLAVCRKTVERHGGRIWIESQEGQGSHFKFTIADGLEDKVWESDTADMPSSC